MDNQFVLSRLKMHCLIVGENWLMSKLISQLSCIFCHGRLLKLEWWMVDLLQNNEHLLGYSPLEIEVLMSPFIFGLPMCSVSIFLNGYGLLYV